MPESVRITLAPRRSAVIAVAVGTFIAFLVMTAIGTLLGLSLWPALMVVYHHANRALSVAGFVVNLFTVLLTFVFISWLAAIGESEQSARPLSNLLRQNAHFLLIARVATAFAFFETLYAFLRQEASSFVIVQVGNATELNFLSTTWAVALGFVLPVALFFLVMVITGKLETDAPPTPPSAPD